MPVTTAAVFVASARSPGVLATRSGKLIHLELRKTLGHRPIHLKVLFIAIEFFIHRIRLIEFSINVSA